MTILYFDAFSGVAGDMVLGAFVDAGFPISILRREIKKLGLGGYSINISKKNRHSIAGTDLSVVVSREPDFKNYSEIEKLIRKSGLSDNVKATALKIFSILADAEAKVHKRKKADVHFHEIGGIDSIIDIVGSAAALDHFGFEKIYSSPLPVTRGQVKCAHGWIPVPAPATLEILKGVPVVGQNVDGEIVTPTGAAILKAVCDGFCSLPLRKIEKSGYGFGDRIIEGRMNALRIMIGEGHPLIVIEANIDDMNPEHYPYIIEKVIGSGAVDAAVFPAIMKKGRPGNMIQVLCEDGGRNRIIDLIMKETTTFGVRYFPIEREMLEREIVKVKTKLGDVRVKVGRYKEGTVTVSPEYSDCQKIAKKRKVPLKEVYRQAIKRAYAKS